MTRLEKQQLLTDLVDQFMQRRERLLAKHIEMVKTSKISLRLEIYRCLRKIEGDDKSPAMYGLIMDFMNSYLLSLGKLLAPISSSDYDLDVDRLEEIIAIYHQLYFKTEDSESFVFIGNLAYVEQSFNRLESLGVPYFIYPNCDSIDGYSDWAIQVTPEGWDAYQAKYRHAA